MKRGIVIATSEATKDFLKPLLDSLPEKYPTLVVGNGRFKNKYTNITNEENEFECGALRHGKEVFDEFIFLMDTCLIKDKKFIDNVFKEKGFVYFMEKFRSYIGKYVSAELKDIPEVRSKNQAISAETGWLELISRRSDAKPHKQLLPHFTENIIEIHGDKRCVIENDYIIKYKKYWK